MQAFDEPAVGLEFRVMLDVGPSGRLEGRRAVVVADDEMLAAWKPLEDRFQIARLPRRFAETEIAENPEIVARRDKAGD